MADSACERGLHGGHESLRAAGWGPAHALATPPSQGAGRAPPIRVIAAQVSLLSPATTCLHCFRVFRVGNQQCKQVRPLPRLLPTPPFVWMYEYGVLVR